MHILIGMVEPGTGKLQLSCMCLGRDEYGRRKNFTGPPRSMGYDEVSAAWHHHRTDTASKGSRTGHGRRFPAIKKSGGSERTGDST